MQESVPLPKKWSGRSLCLPAVFPLGPLLICYLGSSPFSVLGLTDFTNMNGSSQGLHFGEKCWLPKVVPPIHWWHICIYIYSVYKDNRFWYVLAAANRLARSSYFVNNWYHFMHGSCMLELWRKGEENIQLPTDMDHKSGTIIILFTERKRENSSLPSLGIDGWYMLGNGSIDKSVQKSFYAWYP